MEKDVELPMAVDSNVYDKQWAIYHSMTLSLNFSGLDKKELHLILKHAGTISVRSLNRSVSQLSSHGSALFLKAHSDYLVPRS